MPVFAELPANLDTPLPAYLRLRPGTDPLTVLTPTIEGKRLLANFLGVPVPAVGS